MLPFARLLQYGNKRVVSNEYEINLDFSRQALGDTNIIDYSYKNRLFTKLNSLEGKIVLDNMLNENVMYFNGAVFSTPLDADIMLSGKNYEFDVMYKRNSARNSIQVLYGTGYYPDETNNIPGFAHQILQYMGDDQYFLQNDSTYIRHFVGGQLVSDWQRVVYRKVDSNVTITRYVDGVIANQSTYTAFECSNGQTFGVGGYFKTPTTTNFYGYMKYLKLKIIS